MPRFTGGAVGALAYDAVGSLRADRAAPGPDPVGVPTAAFIETDLVLVFDHLTHTLSAIASLHTETPDLEGRYRDRRAGDLRGPRADRTAGAAEMAGRPRRAIGRHDGGSPPAADRIETSLGRDAYIHAVEVAKEAIAAGEAIQVVLARRQSFDLPSDPRRAGRSTGSGSTAPFVG